ncbi:type II toxin-antitoxin system RelE/ParE family toxin [Tahibacter soli]|uniref:Type II toxin-antitoxin system RelE/ParE family toxin n=1 Tax=Tahibacter soli TaxID=2983605 RepID=A0A9X3YHU2_9GAMM|nr:type II toxin-antitoxin system RelE/ParE family toxin [Tahibacter soli]MDC8011897.1 type II toxin-antitoxin system RelE/ParE family toxin [Tahibacter soli]
MAKVFITHRAEADLQEIWNYIAEDNPQAANRQLREIAASCERLAEFPGISFARPEIGEGVRSWPVGAYQVLHRHLDGGVQIVRVVHGARDVDEFFE